MIIKNKNVILCGLLTLFASTSKLQAAEYIDPAAGFAACSAFYIYLSHTYPSGSRANFAALSGARQFLTIGYTYNKNLDDDIRPVLNNLESNEKRIGLAANQEKVFKAVMNCEKWGKQYGVK